MRAFFENTLLPLLPSSSGCSNYLLDYACIGSRTDKLDRVGTDLKVCAVVSSFGH